MIDLNARRKRIYSYALAMFMTLNMTGCSLNKEESKQKIDVDTYAEHFETYVDKGIVEDRVEPIYFSGNVVVGINKKTNKVSRYIYYYGDAGNYLYNNVMDPTNLKGIITELFDLDTGELLFFDSSYDSSLSFGHDTLTNLLEENDFYFLYDYYEDMDIKYKSWYTKEEINEIAQQFVGRKEKIKRLELNNSL